MSADKVRYIKRVDKVKGVSYPRFATKNVETDATKMYNSVLLTLLSLPECARNLMDYLMCKMTENNLVHSNQTTRDSFNDNIRRAWEIYFEAEGFSKKSAADAAISKMYADVTIRKAFSTLRDSNLILRKERGVYMVNPEYFFRNSEKERVNKIRLYLEFESGVSYVKLKAEGTS